MELLEKIANKIEGNNKERPITRNTIKAHPIDSTKIPSQTREVIHKLENYVEKVEKPLTLNTMKAHPLNISTMYQQEYRSYNGKPDNLNDKWHLFKEFFRKTEMK
ncbi:hypothetical protein Mgra_00000666 [Meloidogyne graminicola]|uniref:Uncharacterized protein n=1 Tax=Meloidogyne graminicola TaxID=189291 RepID=A0A8T0A2V0_9BILA|nr:hypothetical protein Mgra_00000666 [Meloidogyne graminicola]